MRYLVAFKSIVQWKLCLFSILKLTWKQYLIWCNFINYSDIFYFYLKAWENAFAIIDTIIRYRRDMPNNYWPKKNNFRSCLRFRSPKLHKINKVNRSFKILKEILSHQSQHLNTCLSRLLWLKPIILSFLKVFYFILVVLVYKTWTILFILPAQQVAVYVCL